MNLACGYLWDASLAAEAFHLSSPSRSYPSSRPPSYSRSGSAKTALSAVRFARPLLEAGYAPAVLEYESGALSEKPLLLYLPGFDGTLLAPFIQFPELGTEFDVRGMEVPMDDRSTFADLTETVTEYVLGEVRGGDDGDDGALFNRPVYLAGESFGGILTLEVSRVLRRNHPDAASNLKGVVLVNPATCFDRSALAARGPDVASLPVWQYPFGVASLLPLFTDEFSLPQLWMILSSEGLPSVIDTAAREAYMGRTALSLPFKLKFMPRGTLRWRLEQWLFTGCERVGRKSDDGTLAEDLADLPVLVVAGERDNTLPSVEEAERLASAGGNGGGGGGGGGGGMLRDASVVVVDGAGHASTLGSRIDLAAEMRARFAQLRSNGGRTAMKAEAARGDGSKELGMEPRYDGNWIGLNPLRYWSDEYFRRWTS